MKRFRPNQKYIAFVCSCVLIFVLASQHAAAARRSRVLSIGLFASGMSLQLGATLLKSSAQERYDAYLNAAIQADIQTHKDAFLVRRNAGQIMSGVGLGCVGLAVLFSIYNQLNTPSESSEIAEGDTFSGYRSPVLRTYLRDQKIDFTHYGFGDIGLSSRRSAFQLRPHYDFQNRQASLRLLHYF